MQRTILHIDFDSFFASVEQQYHPAFRNRPLGVTATNGRNCIIASSREAKRVGIGTGSRVHEAKKICPALALTPADFVTYWEISKKFIAICKDYSPDVEVFSIDELFMDVALAAHLFGGVYPLVTDLKKRIKQEIGDYITVSIGISYNKLLAKLASGLRKPNGVVEIKPYQVEQFYKIAKLTDVCGIGERIKVRLEAMGIYTLLHLRKAPLPALIAEFGNVQGHILKNIGFGIDESEIIPYTQEPEVKSVGRNYCLPHNEYDKRIVLQEVYELCEEVGIKLRRLHKKARTVGFSLRGQEILSGRKTFNYHFNTGKDIFEACFFLLYKDTPCTRSILDKGYIRQISVWAANLVDEYAVPRPLLPFDNHWNTLAQVIDSINEKFGDHTIRNGFLLYADKLTTVPNGYMADKYERTKLAASEL
ncbi:MAG: DNA polymerase IV [Candidatus Levybacteria bacterium]|nr:DNA polymerase IV [Candidatus Levybacteria bacterium]